MASGEKVKACTQGMGQEFPKLKMAITENTGVRGPPPSVFLHEVGNNDVLHFLRKVENKVRYPQL